MGISTSDSSSTGEAFSAASHGKTRIQITRWLQPGFRATAAAAQRPPNAELHIVFLTYTKRALAARSARKTPIQITRWLQPGAPRPETPSLTVFRDTPLGVKTAKKRESPWTGCPNRSPERAAENNLVGAACRSTSDPSAFDITYSDNTATRHSQHTGFLLGKTPLQLHHSSVWRRTPLQVIEARS